MLSKKDIHQKNIQGIELIYGAGRLFKNKYPSSTIELNYFRLSEEDKRN